MADDLGPDLGILSSTSARVYGSDRMSPFGYKQTFLGVRQNVR